MNTWTEAPVLAVLAVLAVAGCAGGDPVGSAGDADVPARLLEVQEHLEAKVAIVINTHVHPDSVPQWWYTTDTIPMDIDGHESYLRRFSKETVWAFRCGSEPSDGTDARSQA